jgi:nucleotide-binding universal stress UspA family protein
MKKILVTTDLSANSKSAIRFALQLASQTKCDLVFYHIFEGVENNIWNPKSGNKNVKSTRDSNLEKLNKLVLSVYSECNIPVKKIKCVSETGIDVNSMINSYAKKNAMDYICIATRGGGVIKKIIGTNTSLLIQNSPVPVIVIPKGYKVKPINSILYSSDLANLKLELAEVKKFAKPLLAEINVYNYDYLADVEEIKTKLDKIGLKHKSAGVNFYFKKLNIENTIANHLQGDASKTKPSILILFTKQNKNWYERLFLRQNTKEVTFDTKTPLLILRKKGR